MALDGRQRFGMARLRASERRPGLSWRVVAGVVLATVVAMAVIPVQRSHPDFSRVPRALASSASNDAFAAARTGNQRVLAWADLVPSDWNPRERVAELGQDLSALSDADPRALVIDRRMREAWKQAPTVSELNGTSVSITGYAVPLETGRQGSHEFLLVPYFGACIHSPPPPANQVVHVQTQAGVKGLHTMDVVTVSGVLRIQRLDNDVASSGYQLDAVHVARLP
jgi:hypothetical protein